MPYEDDGEVASATASSFMLLLAMINCWTFRIRCLATVPTKRPQLLAIPTSTVCTPCAWCPSVYRVCCIRACRSKDAVERRLKQTTSSIYIAVLVITCNLTVALIMLIPEGRSALLRRSVGILIVMWLFGLTPLVIALHLFALRWRDAARVSAGLPSGRASPVLVPSIRLGILWIALCIVFVSICVSFSSTIAIAAGLGACSLHMICIEAGIALAGWRIRVLIKALSARLHADEKAPRVFILPDSAPRGTLCAEEPSLESPAVSAFVHSPKASPPAPERLGLSFSRRQWLRGIRRLPLQPLPLRHSEHLQIAATDSPQSSPVIPTAELTDNLTVCSVLPLEVEASPGNETPACSPSNFQDDVHGSSSSKYKASPSKATTSDGAALDTSALLVVSSKSIRESRAKVHSFAKRAEQQRRLLRQQLVVLRSHYFRTAMFAVSLLITCGSFVVCLVVAATSAASHLEKHWWEFGFRLSMLAICTILTVAILPNKLQRARSKVMPAIRYEMNRKM